jgi:hypothetical protein
LNEAAHREENERAEERVSIFATEEPSFGIVCECDHEDCRERLTVTIAEYEHVRSDPLLFFVAPGHEDPKIEQPLRTSERYVIVRKIGEAADVAEETASDS